MSQQTHLLTSGTNKSHKSEQPKRPKSPAQAASRSRQSQNLPRASPCITLHHPASACITLHHPCLFCDSLCVRAGVKVHESRLRGTFMMNGVQLLRNLPLAALAWLFHSLLHTIAQIPSLRSHKTALKVEARQARQRVKSAGRSKLLMSFSEEAKRREGGGKLSETRRRTH